MEHKKILPNAYDQELNLIGEKIDINDSRLDFKSGKLQMIPPESIDKTQLIPKSFPENAPDISGNEQIQIIKYNYRTPILNDENIESKPPPLPPRISMKQGKMSRTFTSDKRVSHLTTDFHDDLYLSPIYRPPSAHRVSRVKVNDLMTDTDNIDISLKDKKVKVFHVCPDMKEIMSTNNFTSSTPINITGDIVDYSLKGKVQSNEEEKKLYFCLEYSPDFKQSDYKLKWSVSIYSTETDEYHFIGNSVFIMKNSQKLTSERLCVHFKIVDKFLLNNQLTIAWYIQFMPSPVTEAVIDVSNIAAGANTLRKTDHTGAAKKLSADLSGKASLINPAGYKTSLETIAKTIGECQKQAMINKYGIEVIKYDVAEMEKRLRNIFYEENVQQRNSSTENIQCGYSEVSKAASSDKQSVTSIPLNVLMRSELRCAQSDFKKTVSTDKTSTFKSLDKIDLLLIGKTGTGKSAIGNTILGHVAFESKCSGQSVAKKVTYDVTETHGVKIKVVDCPGFGDSSVGTEENTKTLLSVVSDAICLSPQGFHAFLLVVKFGSITSEEKDTLIFLKKVYGKNFLKKFCIFVLTFGDVFDQNVGKDFEEWVDEQSNPHFLEMVKECNSRVVLFDNETQDEGKKKKQLNRLLSIIETMKESNCRYPDEFYSLMPDSEKKDT